MKTEEIRNTLISVHGNRDIPRKIRLSKTKIHNAVSANRRRCKDVGLECSLTHASVEQDFLLSYGTLCKYCGTQMTLKNMAYDHIRALARGFGSFPENMQWICKKCNTRKGPLDDEEYRAFIQFIGGLSEMSRSYIFHKMSQRTKYA